MGKIGTKNRLKSHQESLKMCSTTFNRSLTSLDLATISTYRFLRVLLRVEASLVSLALTSTRHLSKSWRNSRSSRQPKLESLVSQSSTLKWLAKTITMYFSKEVWSSNKTIRRCKLLWMQRRTPPRSINCSNLTLAFMMSKSKKKQKSWLSLKKLSTILRIN